MIFNFENDFSIVTVILGSTEKFFILSTDLTFLLIYYRLNNSNFMEGKLDFI